MVINVSNAQCTFVVLFPNLHLIGQLGFVFASAIGILTTVETNDISRDLDDSFCDLEALLLIGLEEGRLRRP